VRFQINCPLCGGAEDIPITIEPRIIFTSGNGKKGFVTAEVGAGGVEHTCGEPSGSGVIPAPNP
jgi:hypothetical protein